MALEASHTFVQSYAYKLWTYAITSTTLTAARGVAVTQASGSTVGVLHEALTGAGQTRVVVRAATSVTFDRSTALNIDAGATTLPTSAMVGTPVASATVTQSTGHVDTDAFTLWTLDLASTTFAAAASGTGEGTALGTGGSVVTQDNGYDLWTVPITAADYNHGQHAVVVQFNGRKTWLVTLTAPRTDLDEANLVVVGQTGGNSATGVLAQVLVGGQSYGTFQLTR
jgi:hypothetical protein